MECVLIPRGAGFIGSHFGDELLRSGYRVRSLDSLVEQVHGDAQRPPYLAGEIELVSGDLRDPEGQVATDRFDEAAAELTERGLTT
jgi:dTDP-L-rhamnose 4-epimerase